MAIHPSAIVDPAAHVDASTFVGPFCVVGPDVTIGPDNELKAHVYIEGVTEIGSGNTFYPYSSIGAAPQDLKYHGERSATRIGDRNRIREFVTIHRGTEGGGMLTSIGNDNLLMAYTHIAHDAILGDHTVLANAVTLAGHVTIGDWAVIGAFSGVHQFCRVGRHSMIGGYSVVTQDILPFSTTVSPREIKVFGANRVGMERRGFDNDSIEALQTAFRLLTRANLNTTQALEKIRTEIESTPELEELLTFIADSQRGFVK